LIARKKREGGGRGKNCSYFLKHWIDAQFEGWGEKKTKGKRKKKRLSFINHFEKAAGALVRATGGKEKKRKEIEEKSLVYHACALSWFIE